MEFQDSHRPLKIWATMMIFSVVAASALVLWTPGVTGFFSYDTGPDVNLNPDFLTQTDVYTGATKALIAIFGVLIVQVMVYLVVKKHYEDLEE